MNGTTVITGSVLISGDAKTIGILTVQNGIEKVQVIILTLPTTKIRGFMIRMNTTTTVMNMRITLPDSSTGTKVIKAQDIPRDLVSKAAGETIGNTRMTIPGGMRKITEALVNTARANLRYNSFNTKHKIMKTKIIIGASVVLSMVCCKKEASEKLNDTDRNFMKMAAHSNYAEIDAGQLAASKATDNSVKNFGSLMVAEHQTAQNELNSLASDKKYELPTGPDEAHIALKNQLAQMNGHKFDSAYIHSQVMDHQKVLNLFKEEQNNGKDKDVKNYADKYIHHIQMHYDRADSTAKRF